MKRRKTISKLARACERLIRQFEDYAPYATNLVSVRKARRLIEKVKR